MRLYWLLAALALCACAGLNPPSMRGGPVRLVETHVDRLIYDAGGRRVTLAAPRDLCLTPEAEGDEGGMAMIVVEPCRGPAPLSAMRTISLSGAPLGDAGALERLRRWARSEAALPRLSMGGGAEAARLVSDRIAEDALILHVRDAAPAALPVGPARLIRLFAETGGRMVMITVMSLGERGPEAALMERRALEILRALRAANGGAAAPAASSATGVAAAAPPVRPGS